MSDRILKAGQKGKPRIFITSSVTEHPRGIVVHLAVLFPEAFKPILGPIQPPIERVPWALTRN